MFKDNLIGSEVMILDSSVPTLIHKSGKVIDEPRNMLRILIQNERTIWVPKNSSVFALKIAEKRMTVPGKEIIGTPQERIHRL